MRTRAGFFMATTYTKPALTIDQQIALLESRGLTVRDKDQARHFLQFINYYRLSGYTICFEQIIDGKRNHQFKPETSFDDIIALYNFDRHLRILVMDAIERIEVAIRTQICLHMAVTHDDGHWYLRRELFKPGFNYNAFITKCTTEQKNSREKFVQHYRSSYSHPETVPAWMITELLSMGTWSTVYKNLANRSDKKNVSDVFKLSPVDLESWLHALTYIRNLCAHHARLWNRHFTIKPKSSPQYAQYMTPNTTFSAQAAIIHALLKIISPNSTWTTRLHKLLNNHPFINSTRMGFSSGWSDNQFWGIQ